MCRQRSLNSSTIWRRKRQLPDPPHPDPGAQGQPFHVRRRLARHRRICSVLRADDKDRHHQEGERCAAFRVPWSHRAGRIRLSVSSGLPEAFRWACQNRNSNCRRLMRESGLVRAARGGSGRPGSLLTLAPHRSGRAGSAASGSSTDGFATRRRVPAGPGSQAMATAIPKACLASSAIRCRDVETGPNLGVLAVFPSTGATCRCPLPSTGSRGLNSPASAVL